jgi:hypothetical protein
MSEYFCDETHCPPVVGNVIVYRDDSHITAAYSRTLAPMLLRKISKALPAGWMQADHVASSAAANGTDLTTAYNCKASQ